MARTKYSCGPEKFTEVWQQAKSSDEAAEILGMPKLIMHARAADYRSKGIKLKRMPRRSRRLDVEGLNKLIERLTHRTEQDEIQSDDGGSFVF